MMRRRVAFSYVVALVAAMTTLVAAPAVARWNVHNGNDSTQMTAPPGGTELQTCPDRLAGETGWSTFPDDPSAFLIPDDAKTPTTYEVWKAPAGFTDFAQAESVSDADGNVIGYAFRDSGDNLIPATFVTRFSTAPRTPVDEPIPVEGQAGVYVFTTAPIDQPLPSSVAPGDVIGLKPLGGATFLGLTVINCTPFAAAGTSLTVAKKATFTQTVATFTGPGTANDYTASVAWGDGTTSVGTISSGPGGFVVTGTHRYAKKGTYSVTVTITQAVTGDTLQAASTATVTKKKHCRK